MRRTTIDIGTNTILMLISDFDPAKFEIKTVLDIQRIPRLGRGVDSNRNIQPESFEKAINTLNEYKKMSLEYKSEQITATATSFIRDSHNRDEFIKEIKKHTGIDIEILSGKDEARWTFWGGIFDKLETSESRSRITTIDIGGGSTEITSALNIPANLNKETLLRHPIKAKSFNIGSVRLSEKFLLSHTPSEKDIEASKKFILDHVLRSYELDKSDQSDKSLIGVAGTITTLGAIKLGLDRFKAEKVDGLEITLDEINNLLYKLSNLQFNELFLMGNYMEGRADIIIPGTLILQCFMDKFGFDKLTISTKGLRYGVFLREVFKLSP
ncbi:MAG TPA: Ppx/GppA family phosphatase [Ignavibacteria bacterium]|jgi:exopolyphosphatase/guanosine-5'-triphosphate,3'-diphosphate pyrophosphatase